MSLRNSVIGGMFWTFGQQFGLRFVSFLVSIALARVLAPEDFGLIGMLAVFITVGSALMNGGLATSLIRSTDINQDDYSTVFYMNLVGGIFVYIVVFLAAPIVGQFYGRPILIDLIRIYALTFIIDAFSSVHQAKLTKEMQFKLQTAIQIPSLVSAGILGITLAYNGFGVWSLVCMYLLESLLISLQLWLRAGWHPSLKINSSKLRSHFNYGYKIALTNVVSTIFDNLYYIIIGKYFSAKQLGYYTRAYSVQQLPVLNISFALNKVTFSAFSTIQNDNERLKDAYRKLIQQVIFWLAPLLIFFAIVAEPMFVLLFSQKWLPAAPYFKLMCIAGILYPLQAYNLNILNIKGRSDLVLRLEVIRTAIMGLGVLLVIPFGIYGLLYFQIVFAVVPIIINSVYSGRLLNYPLVEQIRDTIPIFILIACVGFPVYLLNHYLSETVKLHGAFIIMLIGLAFFTLYLGISYITRLPAILEFEKILLKRDFKQNTTGN
jgi:O-antigen/teichoic acid export membrane protein